MKKILVSECLYGGRIVRYDGGEKALNHPTFLKWKAEGRLIPVCPEVMGGLPVPRPDSQRVGQRIVTRQGQDVTEQYTMGACEAVMAAGKTVDDIFCVGIDGGRQCWSYIRNGDPMKYSYAQGFELQMHSLCNIIDQIQVKGLNPGDPGCDVSAPQSMLFFRGGIVTKDNVPAVGTSVHQAFDYYDPDEKDPEKAWWNWTDGPGIYMVEGYEKK